MNCISVPKGFLDPDTLGLILGPQTPNPTMKKHFYVTTTLLALGASALFAQDEKAPAEKAEEKKPVDVGEVSYSIGVDIGRNFKRMLLEPDFDKLIEGMN